MDAGAPGNPAPETSASAVANGNGNGAGASLAPDPLQRLGTELEASGGQPGGAQLYEEAQQLLEEAWGIFTECQVMRDGLLAACGEIERAMEGIQHRLAGLPLAIESNDNGHQANGRATVPISPNGAYVSSNGAYVSSNGNDTSPNGNGASANGAAHSSNGTGRGAH
jgi:hypothetical protein